MSALKTGFNAVASSKIDVKILKSHDHLTASKRTVST